MVPDRLAAPLCLLLSAAWGKGDVQRGLDGRCAGCEPPVTDTGAEPPVEWVARLALELDAEPLVPATVGRLLRMAREVAHATERLNAPLCAFVAGRAVQRRVASGADESAALAEVEAAVKRLLAGSNPG